MYEYKAKLIRVIDGDTVEIMVDLGFHIHHRIRVRLLDVDTPEMYGVKHDSDEYAAGLKAKQFVEGWFKGATALFIQTSKTGKYGRWLGIIRRETAAIAENPDGTTQEGSAYEDMSLNDAVAAWLNEQ